MITAKAATPFSKSGSPCLNRSLIAHKPDGHCASGISEMSGRRSLGPGYWWLRHGCARRLGFGRRLVIGYVSEGALESCRNALEQEGYRVTAQQVDVTSRASVEALDDPYVSGQPPHGGWRPRISQTPELGGTMPTTTP